MQCHESGNASTSSFVFNILQKGKGKQEPTSDTTSDSDSIYTSECGTRDTTLKREIKSTEKKLSQLQEELIQVQNKDYHPDM